VLVIALSLIDPSRITPRDWLFIGLVLVIGFWLWHEFVFKLARLVDQLCEPAGVIEMDKTNEDARPADDPRNMRARVRARRAWPSIRVSYFIQTEQRDRLKHYFFWNDRRRRCCHDRNCCGLSGDGPTPVSQYGPTPGPHNAGARACPANLDPVRTAPTYAVIHRDASQSFFCAGYGL
jgi:hypothetical protein